MQFIESIKYSKGQLHNLSYHEARLNHARKIWLGQTDKWTLAERIFIPTDLSVSDVYKCRVVYDTEIRIIQFEPYHIRNIANLQVVEAPLLNYAFKYADRSQFNQLTKDIRADDVLITKKDYLSDTSYANVALFDGETWFTPNTPLLNGTKRAYLLDQKVIKEISITINDLSKFQYIRLINAMMDFEESPTINITQIIL
jgi:4-amino-4-deoxychorismate lyase